MPRGDGRGPAGTGRMTGRGAGFCAGSGTPGYANVGARRGFGIGFGGRGFFGCGFANGNRGRRRRFNAIALPGAYKGQFQSPDQEFEKQALMNHAVVLQSELDYIKQLLENIGKKTATV
jgi:hypothetical protein